MDDEDDDQSVDEEMRDVASTHKKITGKTVTVFQALNVPAFIRGDAQAQVLTGVRDSERDRIFCHGDFGPLGYVPWQQPCHSIGN